MVILVAVVIERFDDGPSDLFTGSFSNLGESI